MKSPNIKKLSDEQIIQEIKQAKKQRYNFRFQKNIEEKQNNAISKNIRRDIARLLTELNYRNKTNLNGKVNAKKNS